MWDPSPTPGARDVLGHITTKNLNIMQDDMFKMLKELLNQEIKQAINVQTQALERMVKQKLITTLSTIRSKQDKINEYLR